MRRKYKPSAIIECIRLTITWICPKCGDTTNSYTATDLDGIKFWEFEGEIISDSGKELWEEQECNGCGKRFKVIL